MTRKLSPRATIACSLLALSCMSTAHAEKDNEGLGFAIEADLEYGGDDLATLEFTDGSSQDIKAGQGVTIALGGHYRAAESPFSVRGTVGYKYVTTQASNADISVGRTVFEVVGNYLWDSGWWIGGGITHHSSIKFDADGFGPDVKFDDATGPTVEVGWRWIALSYTKLDYKDPFGGEWDASSVGLTLTSKF
jgi:hypothetical protein